MADAHDGGADRCAKCSTPFDPTDTRLMDSARRHRDSPFCGACADRCHDSEIADHWCAVDEWRDNRGRATSDKRGDLMIRRNQAFCEAMGSAQAIVREAFAEAFPGPAPECCGHVTCTGDGTCDYVIMGMISDSVRCQCKGARTERSAAERP